MKLDKPFANASYELGRKLALTAFGPTLTPPDHKPIKPPPIRPPAMARIQVSDARMPEWFERKWGRQ